MDIIVGLGKTGYSCAQFLTQQGCEVAVTDSRSNPPFAEPLQQSLPHIKQYLGGFVPDIFAKAQRIIISPGVSIQEPVIAECIQRGVPVIGDIELFAHYAKAPIIGITGTNGKSTVTELMGQMLQTGHKQVKVGGNVGIPVLELLQGNKPDYYVLELSSFQLETTSQLNLAVATILNITPDHLDRYDNFESYVKAKQRIYQHADIKVYNREDPLTQPDDLTQSFSFGLDKPKGQTAFGLTTTDYGHCLMQGDKSLLATKHLKIKGLQNYLNALDALAIGTALKLPLLGMLNCLQQFPGLPYRCQWLQSLDSIDWYNDSKGTNVGATVAALRGLAMDVDGKIVLIAGGQSKEANFDELTQAIKDTVRHVLLFGEDAKLIAQSLHPDTSHEFVTDLPSAVIKAKQCAQGGDAVLLSPACASFDMFDDFEHRGAVFSECVRQLNSGS